MLEYEWIEVDPENLESFPALCFQKPDDPGYLGKAKWLQSRFKQGLRIKQIYINGSKKPNGFVEYVPGEQAWRAVDAKGYLFIHCIWVSPNKFKGHGFASEMLDEIWKEARAEGYLGVATLAGGVSFLANENLFSNNGFSTVANDGAYNMMCRKIKNSAPSPTLCDWQKQLKKVKGLQLIYSRQCPWVVRGLPEYQEIAEDLGLDLKIRELKTAKQAQQAPSLYGIMSLVHEGKLLVDHYVSPRRCRTLLEGVAKLTANLNS